MIFDYRGFGESSEFEIDNNMYIYPQFLDDMKTMINWTRATYAPEGFSIYGWGIGAGLALGVGYADGAVKAIIADSPFLSIEDLENRFSSWDEPMEVPFAGYDKKYEPLYTLTEAPGKALKNVKIIIGSNDILFKIDDMKMLQKKSKMVAKEIYVVENPDRKDNFRINKALYFAEIQEVLSK